MNIKLDIPADFFKGEERCGYYVSPEMKKVWAVELDLIAEFGRVCDKHNMRWFMDAGTLLGAVRHKGFIPWDHDVDVMMLRDDYDRFCEVASSEFQYPYRLVDVNNDPVTRLFAVLYNETTTMLTPWQVDMLKTGIPVKDYSSGRYIGGISLDVFPVDKIPDDENEIRKLAQTVRQTQITAQKIYNRTVDYYPSRKIWRRPIKAILRYMLESTRFNYRTYIMKCVDLTKSFREQDTSHVAKLCKADDLKFMERRVWRKSDFDGVTYFPFEMLSLPAPSGWENILEHFYGDWHKFVIRKIDDVAEPEAFFYDTEHPFTYYTKEGHIPE